ncbi:hypothetical protein PG984_016267 [Apiospora sp. TS-2023a]
MSQPSSEPRWQGLQHIVTRQSRPQGLSEYMMPGTAPKHHGEPRQGGKKKAKKSRSSVPPQVQRYLDEDPTNDRTAIMYRDDTAADASAYQHKREARAGKAIEEFDRSWQKATESTGKN